MKILVPFRVKVSRRSTGRVFGILSLQLSWHEIYRKRMGFAHSLFKYLPTQHLYEVDDYLTQYRPRRRS